MALLIADGIRKSYGARRVLVEASFRIEPGEIVGIVGENGSGKSTLLNIVTGLIRAQAGKIERRGTFGFCPQELTLFDALTVAEHFRYFAAAYRLKGSAWLKERDRLLDFFGYHGYLRCRVSDLSGGTRQKLSLSLAALHRPDLLVLDEPYSNFDWETYVRFWEFARRITAENRSALIVSHLFYEKGGVDRLLRLEQGVLRCS